MKLSKSLRLGALVLAGAGLLGACADQPIGSSYPDSAHRYPTSSQGTYAEYGRVTDVQYLQGGSGSDGVVGAVAGGAVGGLVGNQVGKGSGRTAATVAGAVGGALVGYTLERNSGLTRGQPYYRVTVRMDNGVMRHFDYRDAPNVRVGDRVRAEGNQLYR